MKRIPLSGKRGSGKFALVDDCDYESVVAMGSWHLSTKGYAMRSIGPAGHQKMIPMHKVIAKRAGLDVSHEIDHKDRKSLNNRRFDTPEEAARAYDQAAIKFHGKFAFLNFPKVAA